MRMDAELIINRRAIYAPASGNVYVIPWITLWPGEQDE